MVIFIGGFIFISIIGSLLHFTYDLSNHNKIVGLFSAVNESTWEHIKIALTPLFIWSLVDGYIYGFYPNYFLAKLIGILLIMTLIPLIFYGYTFFTKKHILAIDISSFFIAIGLGQLISYQILMGPPASKLTIYLSVVLLFIVFGFYLTVTLLPIKNFIFQDPLNNKYGFIAHKKEK